MVRAAAIAVLCCQTFCVALADPSLDYRSTQPYGGHSLWTPADASATDTYPEQPFAGPASPTEYGTADYDPTVCAPNGCDPNTHLATAEPFDLTRAIELDTAVTEPLLNFQTRLSGRQLFVLDSQRDVACRGPHAILGAQFRASALAAYTNSENQFAYLGRFPTDFDGNTATDARLLQANQAVVAHMAPFASGYFETLFSDVFTFPTFEQGSWQVRQAYVVLGDLDKTPWYGWLGKKNLDFGDMGTLSPFTQAVPWHYFGALAEGVGVGYSNGYVHINAAAINGGRSIRVADSEGVGDLENFTVNSRVVFPISRDAALTVGAGYLHSTIYDGTTAEHINPQITGPRNAAYDFNARLDLGGLSLAGEFVSTVDDWPVVNHTVSAWRAEAAYFFEDLYKPLTVSASFSEGRQGPSDSEFEFNRQLVVGARVDFTPHVYGTLEWVRSTGFAPLINISTVSNRDVIQDSAVLGIVLAL